MTKYNRNKKHKTRNGFKKQKQKRVMNNKWESGRFGYIYIGVDILRILTLNACKITIIKLILW